MTEVTSPDEPLLRATTEIGILAKHQETILRRLLPHGLTPAQQGVLNRLVRLGLRETITALADAFAVSVPTMSSTISRLAEKEMVRLEAAPGDARRRHVVLTEAGRAAWTDTAEAIKAFAAAVSEGLTEAEWATLAELLERLRSVVEERL